MDDGRTTIDDGRATLIDGGRTTIDDGKRTVIDGGKRTVINDSTMDNGSNPVIDESRRTAIDDDSKRKFFYGTHQQLAKEYRKKESQQLSKLLSLCAKEMIPMTDNFIEKGNLHGQSTTGTCESRNAGTRNETRNGLEYHIIMCVCVYLQLFFHLRTNQKQNAS